MSESKDYPPCGAVHKDTGATCAMNAGHLMQQHTGVHAGRLVSWFTPVATPPVDQWTDEERSAYRRRVADGRTGETVSVSGLTAPVQGTDAGWAASGYDPITAPKREERRPRRLCWSIERIHNTLVLFGLSFYAMEWSSTTPRWKDGHFNLVDALFGGVRVDHQVMYEGLSVYIPMPEGRYAGTVKCERVFRYRPRLRWFGKRSVSFWLEIPKGIPHAGKGENSWDCGDDGLFGIGGKNIDDCIERAVANVTKNRQRYGHASPEAVKEALG